jgi:hypothetical protein
MAKQIAKREVGLGLNISEFARNAKTAEELLDNITEGRTVSLNARLNLGNVQEVLQKIVDQKTVSIRTAVDVKELMGTMEKAIGDFEEQGSKQLAKMNRSFLEDFKTGLSNVDFRLDDGTLVHGYEAAIGQAEKLVDITATQAKITDTLTSKTKKQTETLKKQTRATKQLADAQKKVNVKKESQKTMQDFQKLWSRASKKYSAEDFGKKYGHLMEAISGENPTMSITEAYKELDRQERAHQKKLNAENKKREAIGAELQNFISFTQPMQAEINASANATKEYTAIISELSAGTLKGAEAIERMQAAMKGLREEQTSGLQVTSAIQTNTQAVEENIKAKKKQSKIKVRDLTREEYDAAQEKFQQENDGALESIEDTVEIIRQASQFGTSFSTQMETSCKRATTAVQRFFSAIDPDKYPAIASWKDTLLESVQNGYFDDKDVYNGMYTGQYSWGVEAIDENRYYVFLNLLDVAKDKEKELYAYLDEEYRKRDEGLEKESELLVKLHARYAQLNQLHSYNPKWDDNDEVTSIKNRLSYYEQEKVLLQNISDLREELNSIPGMYKSRNTADALRAYSQNLYLGDYGNATLADNEIATVLYRAELEAAIQRLDKNTALNSQIQVETIEQQVSATETLAQANNNLADSYLKVQEAAKKSLDVTDGSTFATILKYYKELLNAPQDNKIVAAQKALIEKALNGAKSPDQLNALQYVNDSELTGIGNKLMLGASFEREFLFNQISTYLQDVVKSTIDWKKALESVEQTTIAEERLKVEQKITAEKEKQNELIAMHGISTKNLLTALDQGAFPSPSIALTKPNVYSGGYGDATVVFKKSAIDPAQNPANKIYGVDAYTPTHPSFGYELNSESLVKAAERTGIALDELRSACDGAYESADEAAKKLATSIGLGNKLQEAFIKERGFSINKTETSGSIKNRFHVIGDDEIVNGVPAFIAQNGITFDKVVNDDAIQKAYFDAIDKYVTNVNEYFADFVPGQIKQVLVDEYKDTIKNARIDKAIYDAEKEFFENDQAVVRGENKVIDVAAYNDEVQKIINNNRKEYNAYVKEVFGSFMVKPNVIGANGQRFDRTPEGIAEAMSTYGGKGALYDQNAFIRKSIDLQSFIIAASKTYESLDEVVLDMERLQKDATGTHTLSDTNYSISGITSVIAQANKMRNEEVFDKILRAVDGNSTAEAIGKALSDNGLVVEDTTVEKIATLAQEALKVPTRYFEAKPQRTLGIDDIDYVAIPKDSANATELRAKLQEKGIKYVEHTSTDKDSRLAALQAGMQQNWAESLTESSKSVGAAAEQAAQAIEQQAAANKEVTDTSKRVSEQSSAPTQVSNDIINKLTNGVDFTQILTKYGIPSDKLDSGIDLFKDFAGALYQENGGGVDASEIFNTLFEFISKNAQRAVEAQKSLEAFYDRMRMQQIRIPESMESSFEAENTDKWNSIKRLYAIGGNSKNKQRLITTSKYASTPDALVDALIEEGFGYALGVDKKFNGSAQDSLRLLLDAIQRAKDEAKLGKTKKVVGLNEQEQIDLSIDLANIANTIANNYNALNAASSEVNIENNEIAGSAERTAGALKDQASSAEQAANAMGDLKDAEDEKTVFPAEKVETEIDRIRKAIHSSEIGLDQIANTDGLQAAVAAYVKSLDEFDDKKFKLISADINEVAEGVDRVTLKFQSLEDENVKLAQTWAMDDGELTLGRIRTTKSFVDSKSDFDTELERTVANSKVDVLQSQLVGIDHVSQKVTDSLTSLRTAAGDISSDSDIKTFAKNFQVAQNYVKEFKNEYKTLGSLANETQNAQAKMANAQETINAQISSSAKYIGVDGYDKVTQSISNMTSALAKYNEAQKMISDGGLDAEAVGKYEKQMADAFTEYNKAEKQLGAAMKEVRANASFDTFSESMKDAETVIETAKLKLDKFGELDGVDKANGYIKDMTAAWKKFNDADSTIEDKAQAVKDFEAAQKSLAKQMQYLSAEDAWWRKVIDDNPSEPSEDSIKKYAKTLASTFQQINEISSKIYSLELKDDGSGVWSPLISSLEMQKADLLNKVQNIAQQINTTFNDSFVQGDKIEFPFSTLMNNLNDDVGTSGTIENFFNDVRTQTALTEQSIDKFISTLQNGQNKAEEFAITLAEKLSAASKAAQALSKLYKSGAVSSDNELYKGGLTKLFAYNQYKSSLPQDPTTWSSEQISTIQKMASELSNYVSELDKAASKEAEYFKSKKQYANVANMQDYDAMASSMDNVSKSSNRAREDLEKFVAGFTGGRGIVTGFTTSVDGISKINFGVLEEGTNQFRTFSAEMGTFTDKVYTYETSMKNMTAGTEAAKKALASMSQVMSRLNGNGFTIDNNDYVKSLYEKMRSLRDALTKTGTSKDAGNQSSLQNMANDANRLIKTLASLENAWLKVNNAVMDGDSEVVGSIGKNEDVYKKMVQLAQDVSTAMPGSTLSIDGFNQKTKELTYTIEGADGQVKTFVMSMDKLSGSAVASVTKIDKAKTGLQEFLSGIGDTGKQLLQYGLRMVEVYDIIRYLRQGFNEVLQIDTAMTELKKVTDETAVAYDNFAKSAYESSRKIGSTMKEFIQASADFARLGYSLEEASQLAQAANVYKNVGDGIEDVAQASESIISTMKAFNIEATDSMGIVDRFNEIGNNFAIDSVGIGEALQRSASALAEAGNSIDESIALVTAGNTVIQNPEQVGEMLADYKVA